MNGEFVRYWHPHVGLTFERVVLHVHASCHTRDTMFSCATHERFTLTNDPSICGAPTLRVWQRFTSSPIGQGSFAKEMFFFFSFLKPTHCCHCVVYARIFFPRTQCTIAFFCCCHPRVVIRICGGLTTPRGMGWLRLVGSLKLYVSFAKEPSKRDHILQKRLIILRSLLILATP